MVRYKGWRCEGRGFGTVCPITLHRKVDLICGVNFPIVRSGRACGGLTSVLALDPSILFCYRREGNNRGDLCSVKGSLVLVHVFDGQIDYEGRSHQGQGDYSYRSAL